ncbi:MAG: hypothetical protein LZF62_480078 [Nitrospira sp.]|nr:MAG: hypothetical protein LZF62_480078 [Nitrospira sp.]
MAPLLTWQPTSKIGSFLHQVQPEILSGSLYGRPITMVYSASDRMGVSGVGFAAGL